MEVAQNPLHPGEHAHILAVQTHQTHEIPGNKWQLPPW